MKEEVLAYLRHDRGFETGKALYDKIGQNQALKRMLNMQGNHGNNHQLMMHQMAKDAGISEGQFLSIMETAVVLDPIMPAKKQKPATSTAKRKAEKKQKAPKEKTKPQEKANPAKAQSKPAENPAPKSEGR